MADAFDEYEDNSPQAVLRVALAVALADGMLDREEQDKLVQVYADVRDQMGEEDVGFSTEEDVDAVTEDVVGQLARSAEPEDQAELFEEWAEAISDTDLQETALLAALRIAGAGYDFAEEESAALKVFVECWALELDEVLAPFLRD